MNASYWPGFAHLAATDILLFYRSVCLALMDLWLLEYSGMSVKKTGDVVLTTQFQGWLGASMVVRWCPFPLRDNLKQSLWVIVIHPLSYRYLLQDVVPPFQTPSCPALLIPLLVTPPPAAAAREKTHQACTVSIMESSIQFLILLV